MLADPWPSAHPVFSQGAPGWWLLLEIRPVKDKLTTRRQRRLVAALTGDWDGPDHLNIGVDGLPPFLWRKPLFTEAEVVEELASVGVLMRYRCAWIGQEVYYSIDGPDWTTALEDREWHEVDGRS